MIGDEFHKGRCLFYYLIQHHWWKWFVLCLVRSARYERVICVWEMKTGRTLERKKIDCKIWFSVWINAEQTDNQSLGYYFNHRVVNSLMRPWWIVLTTPGLLQCGRIAWIIKTIHRSFAFKWSETYIKRIVWHVEEICIFAFMPRVRLKGYLLMSYSASWLALAQHKDPLKPHPIFILCFFYELNKHIRHNCN